MSRVNLIIYYLIIQKLPHSRLIPFINRFRCWYVSKILGIMKISMNNYFEPNIYIGQAKNIIIGPNCHINENVFIQGANIGSYVMIAPNVSILTKGHNFKHIEQPMMLQGDSEEKIPKIEDNVWIGRNAIILPGVILGEGSIIGAGSVVTKNVEPFSIVAGTPAKLIKYRL